MSSQELVNTLRKYFGFDYFRPGQEEIIGAILANKNVLAVLPTGAGKSLCYQIPAIVSDNFSIVISPLIALMKDQVDSLNEREEIAAFINSTMTYSEAERVLNDVAFGKIKLLYLAPERVENIKFADRLKQLAPSYLFVDEAHCISEWGHNFRPSYSKLSDFINYCSIKKVAAFTATATPEVVNDITVQLGFKEPKIFVRGFGRDNLHLTILPTKKKKQRCLELLNKIKGASIIYTSSRKNSEEVAEYLNMHGIHCTYYHAGMPGPERKKIQEEFLKGENHVIAATNAFGMGIDKKDIRLILHYNTPGSIENYYQEIGRAGRDGKDSYAYLLHDDGDLRIQQFFISNSHPNKRLIQTVYKAICDYNRVAVGSIPDKELIIDNEYISKYAGTTVSKGLLYASLTYLESAGYIRKISEFEKNDSIQLLMNKSRLKNFIRQTSNDHLKNTLLLLLREFGSELYNAPKKISVNNLANKLSIPVQELDSALIILDNLEIISYKKSIAKETISLLVPRVEAERLVLNYKMINESYLNSHAKLDKMTEIVFTRECRFKFILNYFGEDLKDYSCHKCDNCVSRERISDSAIEYLSELIVSTLNEAEEPLTENALIKILKGVRVKQSFELFESFGACKNFSNSEISIAIQDMDSKGMILKSRTDKMYLQLSPIGIKSLEEQINNATLTAPDEKYEDELYLFHLLRDTRKKASEKFMQTDYLICPDDVLRKIVKIKPKTKSELLSINGFNLRMFNKLGSSFLDSINKYFEESKTESGKKPVKPLPKNIQETYKLLSKKYSLKDIAELRKMTEAVISMQIETIIEYKPETEISSLFNQDAFNIIKPEVQKGYENLKELKERLPSSITYAQIRIAAAKIKSTSQT